MEKSISYFICIDVLQTALKGEGSSVQQSLIKLQNGNVLGSVCFFHSIES